MKIKMALVSCLFFCSIGCAPAQDTPEQKLEGIRGDYKVIIEINTKKIRYFFMEPIFCEITLKNTGDKPISVYYGMTGSGYRYRFIVKDDRGQLMPGTPYAAIEQERADRNKMIWSGGQPLDPDLHVGATDTKRLMLNRYVDLTSNRADTVERSYGTRYYDIQVERFGVLSNTVRVEMIDKDFDVLDKEIQMALRTQKYEDQNLLRPVQNEKK